MTIQAIGAFLLSLIASWKNPTNVANDLTDMFLVAETASSLTHSPLAGAVVKKINSVAASAANLASGQLAAAFVVPATFDGEADEVLVFAVRQYKNGTAPAGSPAEAVKTLEGY